MANNFKNSVTANIGTTKTTVYQTPTGATSTCIGLTIANTETSAITVSVQVTDSSTAEEVFLIKDAPIENGGSLVVVGGSQKVVLESEDLISVTSNTATSADVIVSALEQT